jgi:Cation efflux family
VLPVTVVPLLTNFWTVYAAVSSASLSLLATGIDSLFDVGSNVLLYYIHRKSSRMDVNKWPVGGARLETIGNVIYGMTHLSHLMNRIDLSSSGFLCECYFISIRRASHDLRLVWGPLTLS